MKLSEKYSLAYNEAKEKTHEPVIYLSGPYRGATEEDTYSNIKLIEQTAEELNKIGIGYFSPHSNSALFTQGKLFFEKLSDQSAHEHFMNIDRRLLLSCDAMLVCGKWVNSTGTKEEIAFAERIGIPVFYDINDLINNKAIFFSYPKQFQSFREIQAILYQQHREKNLDYSPYNVGATGMIGLVTRIWDKVARLMKLTGFDISSGTYSEAKKAQNEPVEDTFGDLANYSIISLVFRGGLWGK